MIADVTRQPGKYLYSTREGVTPAGAERSRTVRAGELILSNSGSVCIPKILKIDGCIHDGFVAFPDLSERVDLEFAYYWFEFIRPTIINQNRQGITQVNLNTQIVREIPFPLASREEQQMVVAEIERHLSRLENGSVLLRHSQRLLSSYRASVLKAAVEGRLVPTEAELAQRDSRHYKQASAELARIGALPTPMTNLPELPTGWCWTTLQQLAPQIRNGLSTKPDPVGDIPILRISSVRPNELNDRDVRFVSRASAAVEQYGLQHDDLLFTRYNGTRSLVGVCARVTRLTGPLVYPDKLIRVRLAHDFPVAAFVEVAANCGVSRHHLESRIRTTAGQSGISGGDLRTVPLPIPPKAEQQRIVAEVERRFSIIDSTICAISEQLQRANSLRSGILMRAFSGAVIPVGA